MHNFHDGPTYGYSYTWKRFESLVKQRPIAILYETPACELIQRDNTKEILGVRAQRAGQSLYVKARKAVVLTCGGFENSQSEMIRNYLPGVPYCYTSGTPYNEGDGITMAMSVGADLWHINDSLRPSMALKVPEIRTTFSMQALHYSKQQPGGMIVVGQDARRFTDEKSEGHSGEIPVNGRWLPLSTPCADVPDLRSHPVLRRATVRRTFRPRLTRSHRALRLERGQQRATGQGLDQDGRQPRGSRLDRGARSRHAGGDRQPMEPLMPMRKHDAEFGRTLMMASIIDKPFYAVELSPSMLNTQGGPRRNERGQIVRPDGTPIARLYSAGELGSIYSYLYPGTGNIGECLAFGRVSGRNAAREAPWDAEAD